tara:strand:+ start:390 stop:644 length:255 start_codon:yes stop_codon:yes gene_type:complete
MTKEEYDFEVLNYYYLALVDLLMGVTYQEVFNQMKDFEALEIYEACDGVNKALIEADRCTLKEIQSEVNRVELELEKQKDIYEN